MAGEIRDISLAESGMRKIEWVKRNCPLLTMLMEEFEKTKPFAGKKIALSVHLEAKTAYLCLTLASGGAQMYVTGSNLRRMTWQQRWRPAGWRFTPGTVRRRKSMFPISARYCPAARISSLTMAATWFI